MPNSAEHRRLAEPSTGPVPAWRKWGCFVSDRAWGTVREDYSANGDAWNFVTHEKARSKAFRWGEDAIAGLCDRYQLLVFAPAFWNGRDPILKERFFGLTSSEGNRGEDVKDYYFYLDNTPTHSYMRMLYKYPQAEFPYARLIDENRGRGGRGMEFELLDSGIFNDDRYFDIVIEYAKVDVDDICIRIEAFNRGPDDAELHVLPHLWFRNTWGWSAERGPEPRIARRSPGRPCRCCRDRRRRSDREFVGEPAVRLSPRRAPAVRTAEGNAALHQQRDERCCGVGAGRDERIRVHEGRVSSARRQW